MAGIKEINIEEQKYFNNLPFPLVYSPPENINTIEETVEYIKNENNKNIILDKLVQHGAILFRGFPVKDAKDFNDFALAFGWKYLPYAGGFAPRVHVVGVVFTANEAPCDQRIGFHHEMAQIPNSPSNIFFYCDIPPKKGGETPICLANVVYERINKELPEFVQQLKDKGIRYTRVVPEVDDISSQIGGGWRNRFETDDKRVVEEKLKAQEMEFEWLPDGCLKTISKRFPATRFDKRSGQEVWFNSMEGVWNGFNDARNKPEKSLTFGDLSPMDQKVMDKYREILFDSCVAFKWQKGDVLVIDNILALHSRNSFEPPRRILAALFE